MRIVHLSDLHISKDKIKDVESFINDALISDLQEYDKKEKIDLILFSGDLIDRGGISFDRSISKAFIKFEELVITPILEKLQLDKSQFIFAPGNHDIDRNADSDIVELGLAAKLKNVDAVNEHIDNETTEGIQRIIPFKDFERNFHSSNQKGITNYQSCYVKDIEVSKIGIVAFNTAWRCFDSKKDYKNILLGVRQVTEAKKEIKNCDVKIALMHHYFDFLCESDSKAVQSLVEKEFDLLFCGHVHQGSSFNKSSMLGDIFVSIAPANSLANIWSVDQTHMNGYSIIDYDVQEEKYTIHHRKYSCNTGQYVPDTELAPNNGVAEYFRKERFISKKRSDFNINEAENDKNEFDKEDKTESIYLNSSPSDYSVENFQITNNPRNLNFARNINLFNKYAVDIFNQSTKHSNFIHNIETILYIMDRMLYGINTDEYYNVHKTIQEIDHLMEAIVSNTRDKNESLEIIFNLIEWWLIHTYYTLHKDMEYTKKDIDIIFDEILISFKENDIDEDLVEEIFRSAKDTIKYIKQRDLKRLFLKSDSALIYEIIVCLAFPIYINLDKLKNINAGKITGEVESEDIRLLIESIKNEYNLHLQRFRGRNKEVTNAIENLKEVKYTIIKGAKNVGKSGIVAKTISELSNEKFNIDFSSLILIFSFKQSKSIPEMVMSIVEQCNINLINKIDTGILSKLIKESSRQSIVNAGEKEELLISKYEILKEYILEALRRVIKECGSIFLIIDSLELVEQQEEKITFLLQDIPEGCHMLLATGENDECIKWIIDNQNISASILYIKDFTREDISLVTTLNDDSESRKKINDKVFEKTKGQVIYVEKLLGILNNETKNIEEAILENIEIEDISDFEKIADVSIDNSILEEILLLLAVFEPIQPISLENIQFFLSYKGMSYRMPRIRHELRKISNHINDMRFKRIKLVNHEFSNFILQKYYSLKDVEEFIFSVFAWLSISDYINLDFICEFIKYMEQSKLLTKEKFLENISKFTENIINLNNGKRLFDIGFFLFHESENVISLALKLIREASKMNSSEAKSFMGYIYLKGDKVNKDIVEAEKLLRDASNMGNVKAKRILSTMLLEGIDIEQNIYEGQQLLEEAINLGSKGAKLDLALRMILGKDINSDISKGQQLLAELAEEEYVDAMRIMGNRCLYGGGVNRDVMRGKELLTKATYKGSKTAKFDLAKYLLSLSESENDIVEGLKCLTELIEENYKDAKKYYSKILIDGIKVTKDISKGIALLKELVEDKDEDAIFRYAKMLIEGVFILQDIDTGKAMLNQLIQSENYDALIYVGNLLINGKYYEKNIENGIGLLKKASDLGNLSARKILALRLIDGAAVEKNFSEGIKLLKESIKKGDVLAQYHYARVLLEKKESTKEEHLEALDLLENVSYLGSHNAKRYLGILFIDGELVERNIEKGLKYLNEAIDLGDTEAMRALGGRLLFGIELPKDPYKAELLLKKAINLGDELAKTILAHGIILGESYTNDHSEGIKLLEEAAKNESNAKRILGMMLLEGGYIEKNRQRGEELLRDASRKGDVMASLQLARMLLDGRFLNKNIDEGRNILTQIALEEDEKGVIELSNRLIEGNGFDKDVKKGIRNLEELIKKGSLDAKYDYAYQLISGEDRAVRNVQKGEQLLREAEAKGHEDSRRLLANYLIDNILQEKEEKEGIKLLEKAVKENDSLAMKYLGDLILDGICVELDIDRAIQLYNNSIQGRNNECKVSYALKLLEGERVPKDKSRGIQLLKEASHNGSLFGRCELAILYIDGHLVDKNLEEGIQILHQLIEDGYDRAKAILARLLVYGQDVEKDVVRGIDLYEELVKNEYISGSIEYAELLIEGIYIPKNSSKGEKILKQISQKGNPEVNYILATKYLSGDGLKKQVKTGRDLLKKLANYLPSAMIEYGIRLKKGLKVAKNEIKGKEYINKAINKADFNELQNFGIIAYELEDYELATHLFFKRYERGAISAGCSLAYMIRRKEVRGNTEFPNSFYLLEKGLMNNDVTSIINLALLLVKDEKSDDEWRKADLIIRKLDSCPIAAKWWYEISDKKNDMEGHLVLGWLARHNKIEDPSGLGYIERFNKVLEHGWFIPEWMITKDDSKFIQIVKEDETITGFERLIVD